MYNPGRDMQRMKMERMPTRLSKINWLLVAVIAVGLALRLWGISFGLPYLYHPDESVPVTIALRMLQTGNFNPQFFNWPSFLFYLNALAYFGYFIFGRLAGWFASPADLAFPDVETLAVGKAALPAEFLLSRGLTAVCGALSIVLVYLICMEFYSNKAAGWLGAILLAVESVDVKHSQFIRPDTFAVFFALVSFFFALKVFDDPQPRNYVLAGIGAGLATSSKYNVALVFIPIIVAHLIHFKLHGFLRREIFVAALSSMAVFFLTTPFALLDGARFIQIGPLEDAAHYTTGHAGAEGNTFEFYVSFLWATQGWILVTALCEMIFIILRREKKGIVLLSFPLVYFIFINFYTVHFDTTILPLIPFLIILAALFVMRLYAFGSRQWSVLRATGGVVIMGAAVFLALPLLGATAANNARILQPDGREQARKWIDANLPPRSRIALEAYSPYVDRQHFMVEGFDGLIDRPPDWYVQNGFEYLVFSYGAYGRFYENRALYSEFASRYDIFFSTFPQVMRFNDNGYEIRILKTNTDALPAQRVAARFGIYSNWLEMVGYDVDASRWQIGASADFTFYWRSVATRREPLRLTVRLLDRLDHEVTQSSGNLFPEIKSDGRWPEGIARVPWKIAAPVNAAPGMYRLELDVDAGEIGRVPVLSLNREPLSDKLFVGPFKISPAAPSQNELQSAQRVSANFGDALFLLGYSMQSPALRPGDSLALTLYWKSAAKIDRDYTVFVHLIDSDGRVRAQMDAQPFGGAYPTSLWDTGEVARDDYDLNLPRDLAPGTFRIEVGLYEYPSLARLPVMDADGKNLGDHLVLKETIQVAR